MVEPCDTHSHPITLCLSYYIIPVSWPSCCHCLVSNSNLTGVRFTAWLMCLNHFPSAFAIYYKHLPFSHLGSIRAVTMQQSDGTAKILISFCYTAGVQLIPAARRERLNIHGTWKHNEAAVWLRRHTKAHLGVTEGWWCLWMSLVTVEFG